MESWLVRWENEKKKTYEGKQNEHQYHVSFDTISQDFLIALPNLSDCGIPTNILPCLLQKLKDGDGAPHSKVS